MKAFNQMFGMRDQESIQLRRDKKQEGLEAKRKALESGREKHSTTDDKLTADLVEGYDKLADLHAQHKDAPLQGAHETAAEHHEANLRALHKRHVNAQIALQEHGILLDKVHGEMHEHEQKSQGYKVRNLDQHTMKANMQRAHEQGKQAEAQRQEARNAELDTAQKRLQKLAPKSYHAAHSVMSGAVEDIGPINRVEKTLRLRGVIVGEGETPDKNKTLTKNRPVKNKHDTAMRQAQFAATM